MPKVSRGKAAIINLQRERFLFSRSVLQIREFLHQLVELGDVVIDVFVAVLRIGIRAKFGIFGGGGCSPIHLSVIIEISYTDGNT